MRLTVEWLRMILQRKWNAHTCVGEMICLKIFVAGFYSGYFKPHKSDTALRSDLSFPRELTAAPIPENLPRVPSGAFTWKFAEIISRERNLVYRGNRRTFSPFRNSRIDWHSETNQTQKKEVEGYASPRPFTELHITIHFLQREKYGKRSNSECIITNFIFATSTLFKTSRCTGHLPSRHYPVMSI